MGAVLGSGDILANGAVLESDDGRLHLYMQPDGNLVLYCYGKSSAHPLWASGGAGRGPTYYARMHPSGFLYIANHPPVDTVPAHGLGYAWYKPHMPRPGSSISKWRPDTRHPGAWLVVQDDGNVVIYRAGGAVPGSAIWATNTSIPAHAQHLVVPGALNVEVSGAHISTVVERVIVNDSPGRIAVTDGQTRATLDPSQMVGIAQTGTIAIESTVYKLNREDGSMEPKLSADGSTKELEHDRFEIRIVGSGTGYALA